MKTQSCKSTSLVSLSSPSFTRSNFINPMQSGTLSIVMYLDSWHVGGFFWQPLLHRWPNNKSVWQGKTETKIFNPLAWIFSKTGGLFVCFGSLIKSRTDCRFPYLVTLSPQNSVITVCPVTPSTFVHIIVNVCTYYRQLLYVSTSTCLHIDQNHRFISQPLHDVSLPARFDLHLHCILNWSNHHTLPKFS